MWKIKQRNHYRALVMISGIKLFINLYIQVRIDNSIMEIKV